MKNKKGKSSTRRRPTPKALVIVRDQLSQWSKAGFVRLIASHGMQPMNFIGRLTETSPPVEGGETSFSFYSLSGELWVPLMPEFCQTVRVEAIGDMKTVALEDGENNISIRKFDVTRPKEKPDAQEVEKARKQLETWVSVQTPVSMVVYEPFFVLSIEGKLRGTMEGRADTFCFTALDNFFRAAISLDLAESVAVGNLGHALAIWVEGPGGRIMIVEFHDKESLARLLQASGGRVN
jgi:hypothetical protein